MDTVFISHSKLDETHGKEIEDVIRDGGYRAWRFQRDMQGGRSWPPQLPARIEEHDIFLYIATANAQLSENCQEEVQHAALIRRPLVTVVLHEGLIPPPPLDDHQTVYYDGTGKAVARLMRALQSAEPLAWEKIPEDWKTWDGKAKFDLSTPQDEFQEIPMPRIRRALTDMEKENFLDESIGKIRNYFNQALSEFENSDLRVKTRIHDITNMRSFNCEIHIDGKLNKKCTIWIHNQYGMNGIAYYETHKHMAIFGKHPYNELAQVAELDGNPALEFTLGIGMTTQRDDCIICTVDKASECLWKYFTRDFS